MRSHRAILYSLLILLLLAGAGLFLVRLQAVDLLGQVSGLTEAAVPQTIASTSRDILDTSLLKNSKFISLKENVIEFDFDRICGSVPAAQITASTSTSTRPTRCSQGNNVPFAAPAKK